MFFSGFFYGFERCGFAAFPNFRGGMGIFWKNPFKLIQEYCTTKEMQAVLVRLASLGD
jgi:hypothetical protein